MNFSTIYHAARALIRPLYEAAQGRSTHWSTVRKRHLEKHPTCAVCGGKKLLNVHHIRPFHLFKKLELEPSNLITLCEKSEVLGGNCHLIFGHAGNWKRFVPHVVANAQMLYPQIVQARAADL